MSDLRIGEVAAACGVSADTIRHYERSGVLAAPRRDSGGYRRYAAETIDRVRMIRRALGIGFTLAELSRIFKQRAAGQPPCRDVRALAARKLEQLEERIRDTAALRDALAATIRKWDARLDATAPGDLARLLEM